MRMVLRWVVRTIVTAIPRRSVAGAVTPAAATSVISDISDLRS
jgi:hypothetical protein